MLTGIAITLLVLYLVSPIPLLVTCIILARSRNRLRRELEEGRTSTRSPATGPAQPATPQATSPQAATPQAATPQAATPQATSPQATAPLAGQPQPRAVSRSRVNPVTVIFIIGSLFIVASGVLFAGSTWHYLSDLQRAAVLFSLSILFFIASTLADRIFGLKHTGSAFYILAAVFVPVTVLAAGWFGLFGPRLSLTGSDRFILGALAAALFTLCAVYGTFRFRLVALAWAALTSLSATIALTALQLTPTTDHALLVLSLWSALLTGLSALIEHPVLRTHPSTQSLILRPLRPFSLLHLCAIAVAAIAGYEGSPVFLFTIALTGLLFMTPVFNSTQYKTGGMGIFPFTLCLVFALIRAPGTEVITSLVSASAVVMLVGFTGFTGPALRGRSTIAALLVLGAALVTGAADTFIWSPALLIASTVLTATATLRLKGPEPIYRYIHPLLFIITIHGALSLIAEAHGLFWVAAAVLCALCALFYERFKLRSLFSDAVLHIGIFAIWLYAVDELTIQYRFAICAVLTAVTLLSSRRSAVFRWIVPHYFVLLFASFGIDEYTWQRPALGLYAAMTATATALLVAHSIPRLAEARSGLKKWITAFRLPLILWGCVSVAAQLADPAATLLPWFIGLALVWCLAEYRSEGSGQPAWTFFSLLLILFSLALTRSILMALELPVAWTLYGGAATAAFLALFTHLVFPLRTKMEITVLRTVSLASLQLLSACIIMVYLGTEDMPLSYGLWAVAAMFCGWVAGYTGHVSATAIAPILLIFPLLTAITERAGGAYTMINPAYTALFALSVGASLLFYRSFTRARFTRGYHLDSFAITAFLAAAILVTRGFDIPDHSALVWQFYGYLMLSAASLACIRGENSRYGGSAAVTAAAVPFSIALITQPFFAIPEVVLTEYRLVIPLAVLVVLHRLVWKQNRNTGWLIFIYGTGTLLWLGYEALSSNETLDALILGCGSVTSFLISFRIRLKRLFILSSVALIFLGIYMSREFWMSIAWWLYLLTTGILFISIAVSNEVLKKRGESLGAKIGSLFSEWRW